VYYVPLWMLAVCLPVSALAIYLGLRDTEISRPLLYVLTVVLSPVLLLGTAFAAVVASTALSAAFEEPVDTPEDPAPRQEPSREQNAPPDDGPEPTVTEPTVPEPTGPTASPVASPSASPSASASASASPSADQ
jgi:hypothetical protein